MTKGNKSVNFSAKNMSFFLDITLVYSLLGIEQNRDSTDWFNFGFNRLNVDWYDDLTKVKKLFNIKILRR